MSVNKTALGFPPQAIVKTIRGFAGQAIQTDIPWITGYRPYFLGMDFGPSANVAAEGRVFFNLMDRYVDDVTVRNAECSFRRLAGEAKGHYEWRPIEPVALYGNADANIASSVFCTSAGSLVVEVVVYVMYLPEPGAVPDPMPTFGGGGGGEGGGGV